MTIMGQLQPGVVKIVKPGTDSVIGYAFTIEDGNGGQLQRWLLHENPNNEFEIKPAPSMASFTLSDWQAKVRAEPWTANSIYVWAQADVYVNDGTATSWNKIPAASELPDANFPPCEDNLQTEYRVGGALKIQQNGCEGLLFTIGNMSGRSSVEYWMLPSSYEAAGGTCSSGTA